VYDCGSSSDKKLLARRIADLKAAWPDRDRLRLVTLSHFDHDHISGVCDLLRNFKVADLLLPYMPLWKRLLIAFEEGVAPTDDLFRFFLNPVEYLVGLDDSDIIRVIFVGASGEEGPPFPEGPSRPSEPPRDDGERPWEPDFQREDPEDAADAALLRSTGRVTVEFLRRGGNLTLGNFWEFVPYNDDPPSPAEPEWETRVAESREALVEGKTDEDRRTALDNLKYIYEKRFTTSEKRNRISLFLYGGPIYSTWPSVDFFEGVMSLPRLSILPHIPAIWPLPGSRSAYCSVLYTGDGYLDAPPTLAKMEHFLSANRVGKLAVLQVMHHGAESNWHHGVAGALAPKFSVFSSDPKRNPWYHPHELVRRDFSENNPIQVSAAGGVALAGAMCA
jgi:hypothetical protein